MVTSSAVAQAAIQPASQRKGHIRQSVMGWCFKPMSAEELIKHCVDIGIKGIEGVSPDAYPAAKAAGMEIALVGSHGFKDGPVDPAKHDMVVEKIKKGIDTAVEFGGKRVISFSGFTPEGIGEEQCIKNCVEGWKKVVGYAEEKGITICFEHLNTRDDTHPMKGHPGYFADDVDLCFEMIRQVDSPNFKLLFDMYHVQIMNGDILRRIRANHELIGHYHTAGNPGRAELDDTQEINYPAVMNAILETGYEGFVAQEFIPTWDDKVLALRHGCAVCDV
jgi:hydroxypyruvate isomerase